MSMHTVKTTKLLLHKLVFKHTMRCKSWCIYVQMVKSYIIERVGLMVVWWTKYLLQLPKGRKSLEICDVEHTRLHRNGVKIEMIVPQQDVREKQEVDSQ